MEDLFLNATSDIDKILDEFEEREAPSPKQQSQKNVNVTPSHNSLKFDTARKPVDADGIKEKAIKEISNTSASTPNLLNSRTHSVKDSGDVLIDFSAPDLPMAASNTDSSASQTHSLHELDFLLSVLPQKDLENDNEKLLTSSNSRQNDLQSSSASGDNNLIPSDKGITQLESNRTANSFTTASLKEDQAVGFDDDMQIDDLEFNNFLEDCSNVNTLNVLKADQISNCNNVESPQDIHADGAVESISERSQLEESSSGTLEENEVANSQPKFKKIFHKNLAITPVPSSSSVNAGVSNMKSKKKQNEGPKKSSTNLVQKKTQYTATHSGTNSSKSTNSSPGTQPKNNNTSSNESRATSSTNQNQQSSDQSGPPESAVLSNDENKPANIAPPSYSAVIAGDYSAGTIIQPAAPSTSNASSSQALSGAVEHAQEATEDAQGTTTQLPVNVHPRTTPVPQLQAPSRPGLIKPLWVPDENSPVCTKCQAKFTFTRRRHHCRACGKVFCSTCCGEKSKLAYLNFEEARVCISCYTAILQADALVKQVTNSLVTGPNTSTTNDPPVSVLRTDHSPGQHPSKSVRFSDGTKPYHSDDVPATPPPPSVRVRNAKSLHRAARAAPTVMPPLIMDYGDDGSIFVDEDPDPVFVITVLRTNGNDFVTFAMSANLFVLVKLVQYCSTSCYYFLSAGLDSVGQTEVALLLEVKPGDNYFPLQAFSLYSHLFNTARKGKTVQANDFMPIEELTNRSEFIFGSTEYAGFLFARRTVQDTNALTIEHTAERAMLVSPTVQFSSTLFVILVRKSEVAWAKLFYSRLLLGLGAEFQQYPYPLINYKDRPPVYCEIANTILGILCDFRNYKYKVVTVSGLSVLISHDRVTVNIPCNRFTDVMKIMNSSNEHVIALGSDTFLTNEDSNVHLASVQNQSNRIYHTHVLSNVEIQDKEVCTVGAAFIVFNGSLKSGAAQQAKCTIVEEGVMVQLLPEKMAALKEALKAMEDFRISSDIALPNQFVPEEKAGSASRKTGTSLPNHFMEVRWVGDDSKFNIGIMSPVDFRSFEGVVGYNVQGRSEKKERNQVLRWNQVFFFKSTNDIIDMSRLAERVANGCFESLLPHVKQLRESSLTKIGVRVNVHPDDVGYAVGSRGLPLPDCCLNALDDNLIPLTHEASSSLQAEDEPVLFELIFSVLDVRTPWKTISK